MLTETYNFTEKNPIEYLGTWTGSMGEVGFSVTVYRDGIVDVYNSAEGWAFGIWRVTESGVEIELNIGDDETVTISGKLENGKIVVNYMDQDIYFTKV